MPIGDAKLRPGSPAGHEIQARSGFMQNRIESVDFRAHAGLGEIDYNVCRTGCLASCDA